MENNTIIPASTTLLCSSSLLILFLVFKLVEFVVRVWWVPLRITRLMEKQGIRGPPYKFLHGNNKEVLQMAMESAMKPMDFTHDILPRVQPHIYAWSKIYGNSFLSWDGTKPQLFIRDSEFMREVLNNKHGDYQKPDFLSVSKRLFGDGLIATSDEKKWAHHRKLANKAFNAECLKSVEEMMKRWRDNEEKEIEVFNEFRILTLDVISRTAFGSNYLEGKDKLELLEKLVKLVASNIRKFRFPGTGEEKVKNGECDGYGKDFLGMMLESNHDTQVGVKYSSQDILDECKTFYFAGHDTTSGLLTWTVVLLAMHPEWQDKVRKEVIEAFGSDTPTIDGVNRLKIMNMIIHESLRLYPPAVFIVRKLKRTTRFGELIIPSGIEIVLSPIAVHHDPGQWGNDVNLFKPERFLQGPVNAAKSPMAFLPFGYGPRNCAGLNFANLEAKLALSMILPRYAFMPSPSYRHAPIMRLTLGPQHGVPIIINPLQ
ncbi:hypothetical protein AMTRI_Chr10g2480 [Amborella trichopoda]